MSKRAFCLIAFIALLPGCVPVTEPLVDPAKAELDKRFLGEWQIEDGDKQFTIDVPERKGHPRGLMRIDLGEGGKKNETVWAFTAKVGKQEYIHLLIDFKKDRQAIAEFDEKRTFTDWQVEPKRGYWIAKYSFEKDSLTIDAGDRDGVKKLMAKEKIEETLDGALFATPSGFLKKYLEKNGPDAIFSGSNNIEYKRVNK